MVSIKPLSALPEITPASDLSALIGKATLAELGAMDGAVLVVAQKVVSKAENRFVSLADVEPGEAARALAAEVDKDPRLVELILRESRSVVRKAPGVLVVEHRCGPILANAGIDSSNVPGNGRGPRVLLWPEDPDASARRLSLDLEPYLGFAPPVIVSDSIGRAWRNGTVGHAIGVAGLDPLWCQIGERDRDGQLLRVTEPATADALAAAAGLVQGEAAEGRPAVWIEGAIIHRKASGAATQLLRDPARDLFR